MPPYPLDFSLGSLLDGFHLDETEAFRLVQQAHHGLLKLSFSCVEERLDNILSSLCGLAWHQPHGPASGCMPARLGGI